MSEESFKKFLRSKSTTLTLALAMATAANASAGITPQQKENLKKETKEFVKGKSDSLNIPIDNERTFIYSNVKNSESKVIKRNLDVLTKDDVVSYDAKNTKTAKNEYNEQQTEAFNNAPENEIKVNSPQDFIEEFNNNGNIKAGGYSFADKNIVEISFGGTKEEINQAFNNAEITLENNGQEKTPQDRLMKLKQLYENDYVAQSKTEIESVAAHENQHMVNDKANTYAPGLNAVELGKLNCWDECSANLSQLILANHHYKADLAAGKSQEEALKQLDVCGGRFSFYKDEIAKGLNPDSKEAKELMVQGTVKMWKNEWQTSYEEQILEVIQNNSSDGNTAGLVIGNEKDYQQRVNKMFDSFDKNPKLQELGITVGKLSQYLPKEDFQLSEKCMETANQITKERTGFSLEEGRQISQELPGSQKKDQKNFAEAMSNPQKLLKLSGRISYAVNKAAQNESNLLAKNQQQSNSGIVKLALQNSAER